MPPVAITLDAYGTLFDIEAVMLPAVEEIVRTQGLDIHPPRLSDLWTERFHGLLYLYGHDDPPAFRTIRQMTTDSLVQCFAELGAGGGDVPAGVEVWFDHVRAAPLFPEVRAAVERLARHFRLAVISDADDDVIARQWREARLPVAHVFTSERVRAYKIDPRGTIFRAAFDALGVRPGDAVHVGDSRCDVVGALRAGAGALWLSRGGAAWHHPGTTPTHVARDLAEAADLLIAGA